MLYRVWVLPGIVGVQYEGGGKETGEKGEKGEGEGEGGSRKEGK